MKQAGEALTQHLNTAKSFRSCDLYALRLQSGMSYYWTDTDSNVSHGGHVYRADGPVITRNKTSTHSDVAVDKLSVLSLWGYDGQIGGGAILAVG